jgi:hypothetical protein
MKYTAQTSKYVLKNLFYILPFALVPALFLSISLAEEDIIQVLHAIIEGDFSKWTFTWRNKWNFGDIDFNSSIFSRNNFNDNQLLTFWKANIKLPPGV